jgi:hypothetical protein
MVLFRKTIMTTKPALAPAPGLRLGRRGAKGASAAGQGFFKGKTIMGKTIKNLNDEQKK